MNNYWESTRIWSFYADMNGDGVVTISDVWLWIKWLFFYPGDFLVLSFGPTNVGQFFELSVNSYGGTFAFIASLISWPIIFLMVPTLLIAAEQGVKEIWRIFCAIGLDIAIALKLRPPSDRPGDK